MLKTGFDIRTIAKRTILVTGILLSVPTALTFALDKPASQDADLSKRGIQSRGFKPNSVEKGVLTRPKSSSTVSGVYRVIVINGRPVGIGTERVKPLNRALGERKPLRVELVESTKLEHAIPVLSVAWSPDGSKLVSGTDEIHLWSKTGERKWKSKAHATTFQPDVDCLSFSKDGKTIFAGTSHIDSKVSTLHRTAKVQLFNLKGVRMRTLKSSHNFGVKAIALSADSQTVFGGSGHFIVGRINGMPAITVRGGRLISWDIKRGTSHEVNDKDLGLISALAMSPNGKMLATGNRSITFWNPKTLKPTARLDIGDWRVHAVRFSPDGKRIAVAGYQRVEMWDVATRKKVWQFKVKGVVNSMDFSPDGKILATGGGVKNTTDKSSVWYDELRLVNSATGKLIRGLFGHEDGVFCVSFSPNGNTLASASNDKTVRLWKLKRK